ncbi:hypothetical protein [Ornithinimicrobium kibberense]|uniref:hypothetical protein n=1 Tax=Ornithinimicrobium kibberense TaxID=282060 RepID=UPI00361BB8A9
MRSSLLIHNLLLGRHHRHRVAPEAASPRSLAEQAACLAPAPADRTGCRVPRPIRRSGWQ